MGEDVPAVPTDFSRGVERTELPAQLSFDTRNCEKAPLPAAVAAGIVQPRTAPPSEGGMSLLQDVSFSASSSSSQLATVDPALMSTVQALAAQSGVSPEQLLQAARQVAGHAAQAPSPASQINAGYPAVGQSASAQPTAPPPKSAMDAFEALDPLNAAGGGGSGTTSAAATQPSPTGNSADPFGDVVALAGMQRQG